MLESDSLLELLLAERCLAALTLSSTTCQAFPTQASVAMRHVPFKSGSLRGLQRMALVHGLAKLESACAELARCLRLAAELPNPCGGTPSTFVHCSL